MWVIGVHNPSRLSNLRTFLYKDVKLYFCYVAIFFLFCIQILSLCGKVDFFFLFSFNETKYTRLYYYNFVLSNWCSVCLLKVCKFIFLSLHVCKAELCNGECI